MKQFNKLLIIFLLLAFNACTPANLSYSDAQQRNSRKLENDAQRRDAEFLVEAANYNIFFVASASRAAEESYARVVSDYAKNSLQELRRIDEDIRKLAKDKKMSVPSQMSERHQQLVNELNTASQRSFDRAYLNTVEAVYERAIRLYEDAALRANDSNIRAFAASKLDVLRAHERRADELENQLL